ncbi:MAG: tetratricopeptide repeat protein [Pseudomonadota bacterium]|nr:tetratricopeptide repeat protein [Pseudomonadota bacterium]
MDKAFEARRLHQQGRFAQAEPLYRQALQDHPQDYHLVHDLGVLLLQSGQPAAASEYLSRIPTDADVYPQAVLVLATALRAERRLAEALQAAQAATRLQPAHPLAWLLQGSLLVLTGQPYEAEASLRNAVQKAPDFAEAWHYLGESLQAQRRYQEAKAAYQRAASAQPGEAINIGICAEMVGDLATARQSYIRMLNLAPDRLDVAVRLANVAAQLCLFDEVDDICARISQQFNRRADSPGLADIEPFPLSYLPLPEAFKRDALDARAQRVQDNAHRIRDITAPVFAEKQHPERIRIGYISPDFGNHAVGQLLRGHFAAHDRTHFEVFAYSLRQHQDEVAAEIAAGVEHFVDCEAAGSELIAQRISHDRIDLLIDLGGYTFGARPEVLAMRPGKYQLGWLGFIHGQQAAWLDGIILDRFSTPDARHWPYQDRIIDLGSPLFPAWQPTRVQSDREKFGLPPSGPLLVSFNNSYKLDTALLSAWAEILRAAPTAQLAVFLRHASARGGFLASWQATGGDPRRLHFVEAVSFEQQLRRAASCDLFLDAFRYQAGATAIFSIAAGLPVLTHNGQTPNQRMSAAINRYLGMDELVCAERAEYIKRAIDLANHPTLLAELRARLGRHVEDSDLLSPRRSAAAIERIANQFTIDGGWPG